MSSAFSLPTGASPSLAPPIDPALIASMASALFGAFPGEQARAAGVQTPVNIAPAGSPLVSPAGFGPGVPGTPVPQGLVPGANLIPASPTPLASLAHRAPALALHAQAGNGLPDNVVTQLPAYEPRFGSGVLGVPEASGASASEASRSPLANASPFYFLSEGYGHPSAGGLPMTSPISDGFAQTDFAPEAARSAPAPSGGAAPVPAGVISSEPKYYFVDSVVLPNGYVTPAKAASGATTSVADKDRHPPFDVNAIRRDFPILQERVNGKQLVWFDNAATTQKPQSVIDRLAYFYAHENSNIHRAAHELAARATDAYESAREKVRAFINAPDVNEVIFVRGTTEAINLVAKSWGGQHIQEGDEIIVSNLEHHANIVPWQQLASAKGAKLRVIPVDDSGQVLLDEYAKLLNDRTKIVSVTQVSNALGTVVPVKQIVEMAHRAGAIALVDGAQSVSHMPIDVQDIGADFFVFSGHKVFGPTGIGALWGKRAVLEDMPPWQGGGNMIADVTFEKTVFQPIPNKFEAGTGNIADAVGLGAAIDYVTRIGMHNIDRYEHELLAYGMQQLATIPGVRLVGTAQDKASVMSFVLAGYSTDEVGKALNKEGIAVRTGHHCAQPILRRMGLETTVRPSLAFYNTFDEVDQLVAVVRRLAAARVH
ncbi:cysteine desulfurase [Rhodoferax lithotrophicus]|uniref:cysteine desulfurase n=1 Tax=Rhodoferax lithotrophicus TaxID=2798804 RepID=A0ABN6D8N7_9BURK|nr:family 2A encapsulin nanocompartment cargo protein cysteine desulfurase [Rhodoferax sp. MIZ03]BCO28377.1 cysteine desulfurase [Rhodoferax sp. MIZ03]